MTDSSASRSGDPIRRIARGSALTGLGALVAAGGGVALTLLIARAFLPEVAGTFFASTTLFLIVGTLAQLGTDVGLVRYLSAHSATGQEHRLTETLRIALLPVLAVSLCCAVALGLLASPLADWIGSSAVHDDATMMLRWLAPFVPVVAVYGALLAATRGLGSMKPTVSIDSIFRSLAQPGLVLLTVLAGGGPTAAVLAWVAPYVVGTAWCVRSLILAAPTGIGTTYTPPVHDVAPSASARGLTRDFWSFTGARAAAGAVLVVWRRFDILLVAALAGPADAAIYTAATRFLVVGNLGIQAVLMAVSPQLARLFARHDNAGANRVFATSTLWTMVFSWPMYLVTAAAAGLVIPIFGAGYSAGTGSVIVLSLAMLVATACGSVDAVLLMSGRSLLSLANAVVTLIVNIALDLVLIPRIGILGAAIGWACAIALRNLLALAQIHQLLGMWAFSRRTAWVAGLSTACFGVVPAWLHLTSADTPELVLSLMGGGVLYLAWLWRERRSLELDVFARALRRNRAETTTSQEALS